jgi:hypothetical protein
MSDPTKTGVLLPLATRLKACPTQDNRITPKLLVELWGCFKTINLEQGDTVTPAVLVGVILYDPGTLAPLLNRAEHAQLQALGQQALERYQQQIHPPNQLGKTIAAALKENT